MGYRLEGFAEIGLDERMLELLIAEHERQRVPHLDVLWRYFRNPLEADRLGGRPRSGQEAGLPSRLTGEAEPGLIDDRSRPRREVVVENDIAWRIQTMVDFMFGKPVQIVSTAPDEGRRREIERVLDAVWEASGGIGLLQDMALLGSVFGYVDLVVRLNEGMLASGRARLDSALRSGSGDALAELVRIEPIDPRRGIPVIDQDDYRKLAGYAVHFERELNEPEEKKRRGSGRWLRGRREAMPEGFSGPAPRRKRAAVTEILGPGLRQVYEGGELVLEERSALLPGVLPVVHVQNLSQPYEYEGLSEVEPLIALQDELNTRLSDRASRVTMQSFKMYLAKRLDGFERVPAGPGVVWSTDDPEASIEAFGGDGSSPSESEHIDQIREAMDKISSVPPLAGGVIRARIGNLSSATALRITLMSLLSKTGRKRVNYGRGIAEASRMVLSALNASGAFRTSAEERGVRLIWPDPQPADARTDVVAAQGKVNLGVPAERVLNELGYGDADAGVQ